MASWQENLNSVLARSSHIFSSGNMSDVTFVVGEPPEQKRFKLHKFILSMSSDVFFTMFYGSLPEMGEVKVPDIEPDIFEIMMKYVYEDSFSVESVEQAMYTYCAAEKYNISHLRDLCAAYITDNLSLENLPILYRIPAILENLQIKSKCKTMISENTSDILRIKNFAKAPLDMVKDIVQLENVNILSEENLFELVLEWAKSFCLKQDEIRNHFVLSEKKYTRKALRAVMDNFLPHIRFLAMSTDFFHLGPASSGILTDNEIASISQNIVAPGRQELPVWCNRGMSRNTMLVFPLTESHNCLFREGSLRSVEGFITIHSGNILFKGVTVYVQSVSYLPTASLQINIVKSRRLTILEKISTETKCSFDNEKSLLKCMLLKPLPLSLSKVYQICVSSNHYIFSCCGISHSATSVKRKNQDFEMEYRFSSSNTIMNYYETVVCYPHFYEILYSKI